MKQGHDLIVSLPLLTVQLCIEFHAKIEPEPRILIEGAEQHITCYGGSNISTKDAWLITKEKAETIAFADSWSK